MGAVSAAGFVGCAGDGGGSVLRRVAGGGPINSDAGWQDKYDLDHPVVAIVGVVDTGKSSLLECIAYAMGRDIEGFRGAVDRYLREVEVAVRVHEGTYLLRRARASSGTVEVLDSTGTSQGRYPVSPQDQHTTISEQLLEWLGLVDTFGSVRLSEARPLDFAGALLPYCYLTQGDIDRHIISSGRDDKARLVALKLMLNLTSPEFERLSGEIHENQLEIDRLTRKANLVTDFLAGSPATELADIDATIARLQTGQQRVSDLLTQHKNAARTTTGFVEAMRARVTAAAGAAGDAEIELDSARRKRARARARLEDVVAALQALDELEQRDPADRPTLALADTVCVVCRGDVSGRPLVPGCCYLCQLPLPGQEHLLQRHHLNALYQQAVDEVDEFGRQVAAADKRAQLARGEHLRLAEAMDAQTGGAVSPFVDAITAAAAEHAAIAAQLETLSRVRDAHTRLEKEYGRIRELTDRQGQRRERLQLQGEHVEHIEDVIGRLDAVFGRIVHGIALPNATGRARIDPDTLLPWVDDQSFTQRGGGARSAVSIAYSLALLTYTLENEIATLPGLLIIDSPQKNFGANRGDKQLAHSVYERFLNLMDERRRWGGQGLFARPFQVIIVDNDIHRDIAKRIHVHRFTREQGFIRDLVHPHGAPVDQDQLRLDDQPDDETG